MTTFETYTYWCFDLSNDRETGGSPNPWHQGAVIRQETVRDGTAPHRAAKRFYLDKGLTGVHTIGVATGDASYQSLALFDVGTPVVQALDVTPRRVV